MVKNSKTKKKTIVICTSASFFKQALDVQEVLEKRGFKVLIPSVANVMKKSGDFRVETYKTWFNNPEDYKNKSAYIKNHFKKIVQGDSILVLNYDKKGVPNYIGGATLGEMFIAFHLRKKIYVLNAVPENVFYQEEILAMQPVLLNGDLSLIK